MSDPISNRRWFRFSLQTLFVVVTLVCGWLGWNAWVVQQRDTMMKRIAKSWSYAALQGEWRNGEFVADSPPFLRRMLGDELIREIWLAPDLAEEKESIQAAFPETSVSVDSELPREPIFGSAPDVPKQFMRWQDGTGSN